MLHLRKHLLPLLRAATAAAHLHTSAASSSSLHRRHSDPLLRGGIPRRHLRSHRRPGAQSVQEGLPPHLPTSPASASPAPTSPSSSPSNRNSSCVRADNIARRIASLRDRVGLSDPQIGVLLRAGGAKGLRKCDIAPNVEFLIPFVGSFDMLLKMGKANYRVFTTNIEKVIKPNIAVLQECGLTVCDIVKMAHVSRMLPTNPKRVETSVQRADQLGVRRSSGLFKYILAITCCISEDKATARTRFLSSTLGCSMDKIRDIVCKMPPILGCSEENISSKIEFLASTLGCSMDKIRDIVCKSPSILGYSEEKVRGKIDFLTSILGCPQEKIRAAVCKQPSIIGLSDENLRHKIYFIITEVGLESEDIVERPWQLTYSLKKRMVPRHSVIKILRAMGKDVVFSSSLSYSEKKFIARYIDPYKKAAPTLADAYAAACAGKMSDEVHL